MSFAKSCGITALLMLACPRLIAHHNGAAEFDIRGTAVVITGRVKEVRWENPHVGVLVEVNAGKKRTVWLVETFNPKALMCSGWTSKTLRVGQAVTVRGFQAKNGAFRLGVASISTPSHTTVFSLSKSCGREAMGTAGVVPEGVLPSWPF